MCGGPPGRARVNGGTGVCARVCVCGPACMPLLRCERRRGEVCRLSFCNLWRMETRDLVAPASPLLVPDSLRPGPSASRLHAAPMAGGGDARLNPLGDGEGSVAMQRSARSSETQGTAQSSETSRYRIPCRGMRTRYHLINPIEAGKAEMFQSQAGGTAPRNICRYGPVAGR